MAATQPPPQASPFANVTAGSIMRPGVLVAGADASARAVARIMAAEAVHAVLVPADGPRGLGWPSLVVSDLDVVRVAAASKLDKVTAAQAGSRRSVVVDLGETLTNVAADMAAAGRDHTLVAGRWSHLPDGIVSAFDLVAVLGGRDPRDRRVGRGDVVSALGESHLDRIAVREAMRAGIIWCAPDAALETVARSLADHHVHCVVVGALGQGPAGEDLAFRVIEAMDLVRAAVGSDPAMTAADVAVSDRPTIREEATMAAAARTMADRELTHLVVTDALERPVGVISTLDVAAVCAAG